MASQGFPDQEAESDSTLKQAFEMCNSRYQTHLVPNKTQPRHLQTSKSPLSREPGTLQPPEGGASLYLNTQGGRPGCLP